VSEQQKASIKAQSDCRSYSDTLKSTRGELQRLEKQAASVIIHVLLFTTSVECFATDGQVTHKGLHAESCTCLVFSIVLLMISFISDDTT